MCHHCDAKLDSHTVEECPTWVFEREALVRIVGDFLTLPVKDMLNEELWKTVSFCEVVMQKKGAERERERERPDRRGEKRRRQ